MRHDDLLWCFTLLLPGGFFLLLQVLKGNVEG